MGRYDEALADFNRAIELDPSSAWAIAGRGETYRAWGATTTRWLTSTAPSNSTPSDAWAIAIRGQTYRAMGRYDEALADFNRAIELDPSSPGPSPAAAKPTG